MAEGALGRERCDAVPPTPPWEPLVNPHYTQTVKSMGFEAMLGPASFYPELRGRRSYHSSEAHTREASQDGVAQSGALRSGGALGGRQTYLAPSPALSLFMGSLAGSERSA